METRIVDDLNEQQQMAVRHTEGPVLVFAGAGSGKTRVLTYRIAHLIKDLGVKPWNILAVTFTNKAAREMRERIESLLGESSSGIWAGTFHGICARMLREHGDQIGVDRDFTIFDDADQVSLVRECMESLRLDQKKYPPRDMLSLISKAKESLVTPQNFGTKFVGHKENVAKEVYKLYAERLKSNHALDFDDLIMLAVLMLRSQAEVRQHYEEKFHYVHVDEYQDINYAQYLLVNTLAGQSQNVFCVGDDDQSIYRWRGADVNIILQFEQDYPNARVYKLEQNYRSTKKILEAAHHVVKRNRGRSDKKLWTNNDEGCEIEFIEAASETEEATQIARSIEDKMVRDGRPLSDFVVLYRMNAQSRVLEDVMVNRRIPYRIVGSLRFYQRKEVKDIIAYMRLALNPHETVSLRRVINVPLRGIGQTSLDKLDEYATSHNLELFTALQNVKAVETIAKRSRTAMELFGKLIEHLHELAHTLDVHSLTREILETTGYADELAEERTLEAQNRLENVRELLSVTQQYVSELGAEATLSAFLEHVALISDIDSYEDTNAITLMTLHSAKGLEFPVVFLTGMEEGIFPHWRAIEDREEMEEERRLCYVGMTRARHELVFTRARQRNLMGQTKWSDISRFIKEIPEELLDKPIAARRRPELDVSWRSDFKPRRSPSTATFRPGQKVHHSDFGDGLVINSSGTGEEEQVTVAFDKEGIKKLQVSLAGLTPRQ